MTETINVGDTYMVALSKTMLGPRLAEFSGKIITITAVFESKGKTCASFEHRYLGVGAAFVTDDLFVSVTAEDIAQHEKRVTEILKVLEECADPVEGAQALASAGFRQLMEREEADQTIQGMGWDLTKNSRDALLDKLGW